MSTFEKLLQNMILSASGWRGVFAESQDEEDSSEIILDEHRKIVALAAQAFCEYMKEKRNKNCTFVVGRDSRPTGKAIADAMLKSSLSCGIEAKYIGVVAAPEIMSYAKEFDGFMYISASHNPIGHNGIKFGFSDGGVMPASDSKELIKRFLDLCKTETLKQQDVSESLLEVYNAEDKYKNESFNYYTNFTKLVVSGEEDCEKQDSFFNFIKASIKEKPLTIVCDMNGSARTKSIDKEMFSSLGIGFEDFNNVTGNIVHAIIPEGKNLEHCAKKIETLQKEGKKDALLGYMPDCDGDRGNIVFWNSKTQKAEILQAQEVFALSVLSELCFNVYKGNSENLAVAINGPTSMRIDDIAKALNAKIFRGEVGEANIVNCAREQRKNGYTIPIMGEGSNGGNITFPAAVRDPINTLFALIKLLTVRSSADKKGLFELWCERSNQNSCYKESFDLVDIIETLPKYETTGVSEDRALLHIETKDHTVLKQIFQKVFIKSWKEKEQKLQDEYGFYSWEAIMTVGTQETRNIQDFGASGTGGLKILFKNKENIPIASMWMRGSGTEPVFRIMVDIQNGDVQAEKELIAWESELLALSDKM